MREIKFRAWRESDNQMITENNMHSPRALYFSGKTFYTYEMMSTFGGGDGLRYEDGLILMQYTGRKDINGIEIYEGDIIESVAGLAYREIVCIGGVEFKYDSWVLSYKDKNIDEAYTTFDHLRENDCTLKVIGNIYENPDLLKG